MCADQKLSSKDALKVVGLKDIEYRILKIIGENVLLEEEDNSVRSRMRDFNNYFPFNAFTGIGI